MGIFCAIMLLVATLTTQNPIKTTLNNITQLKVKY